MRTSLTLLTFAIACTGAAAVSMHSGGSFTVQQYQADDPCGDIPVTTSSRCTFVSGGESCTQSCEQLHYQAACADHNYQTCSTQCQVTPKTDCTTSCDTSCEQECEQHPEQTFCTSTCENRCDDSCGTECQSDGDSTSCTVRCKTTCENSCEHSCQTIPASATCTDKCQTACGTSCETSESMECQEQCQNHSYQSCEQGLATSCQTDCTRSGGYLDCDDQFVDAQNIDACKQYLQSAFSITVSVQ
jgi:hypothetical protein